MNDNQAYQTLNLDSNASFDDIKYAYRKLALELHPDKNFEEKDGNKFKSVTTAYHVLKNSHKKSNVEDSIQSEKKETKQNFS